MSRTLSRTSLVIAVLFFAVLIIGLAFSTMAWTARIIIWAICALFYASIMINMKRPKKAK